MPNEVTPPSGEAVLNKLKVAVERLIQVEVTTVISQVEADITTDDGVLKSSVTVPPGKHDAIYTNINLASGDVTNVIAPKLEKDTELRAFHEGVLDRAVKVLPSNLSMLADACEKVFNLKVQGPDATGR